MKPHRIQQLSMTVANQIAAGEVIERPASVVKELLENAWDAGADSIDVEIGFGGFNQVRISDNGSGIDAADLPLAIAAHATSKIVELNDLYALTSLGFRGEALASIASVSRMSISSKPKHQANAMILEMAGGCSPKITPCARSEGTTVDVLDLFYNAPVRKKFLKSQRSEFQAIEFVVKRFALSTPGIAVTLSHDGKQVLNLPPATCEHSRLQRVKKVLGKSFVEQAVFLDVSHAGMRVMGWVSSPSYQRSQNDKQWVYVNQRMMKDKLLHHAIKFAYGSLLYPGRYPACLLYFTLPADVVDVNVHPTKHEVRFQEPQWVHDFISSAITGALAKIEESTPPILAMKSQISSALTPPSLQSFRAEPWEKSQWVTLNERFAWVFLQGKSYLLDVSIAYQYWLLSRILESPYPLASRPLLVPVSHSIDKANSRLIELYQSPLMSLGISLDWIGERKVIVRTLPLLLPQLDLKKLLHLLNGPAVQAASIRDWCKVLMSCQSFDLTLLSDEDKAGLMGDLNLKGPLNNGCVPFGMAQCLALFGEGANV